MFFDFYVTLWGIIPPKKRIRVKIRLEKVDLGEVYIQKEQENFKKRTSSNTTGGPLHMSHPVGKTNSYDQILHCMRQELGDDGAKETSGTGLPQIIPVLSTRTH